MLKAILFSVVAGLIFGGCESMRVTGTIQTTYGAISSDGKTVNLALDARGLAK